MNKMQKLVLLVTFWMEPVTKAKTELWKDFTLDRPMDESEFFHLVSLIALDKDGKYPEWSKLTGYKAEKLKALGVAA